MDLRKFIAETLTQINSGITDAQINMIEFHKDGNSDYIAPYVNPYLSVSDQDKKLNNIEFDVAVTVSDGKCAEGSGGLSVMGVSIGGNSGSEQMNSSVSRIKFSIPVRYSYVYKKNTSIVYSLA